MMTRRACARRRHGWRCVHDRNIAVASLRRRCSSAAELSVTVVVNVEVSVKMVLNRARLIGGFIIPDCPCDLIMEQYLAESMLEG